MSLKKWEIKLGIHHQELGLPWDEPVPEEKWPLVADYCGNDVDATEATFDHLSGDWVARQILAVLSSLTVNDTTNQHTSKIVFGNEKNPQKQFNYPDLRETFPGYKFENGKSTYRGITVGEGGLVYAEPGMYSDVPILDATSMHPSSIEAMNLFGPYTKNFSDLKTGRVAIKHKEYARLKTLLNGKLVPFIDDALSENPKFTLKDVSKGLKTAINAVYGLTIARFDNPFRDPRNIDNVVAKRGALFMVDLLYAVQEKGFTVAHIKTDSIKIPNATQEILDFVSEFGKKYGYDFEHEATYEKFCLVNDAVYIAKIGWHAEEPELVGTWTATGTQFAQPYVFKTLFSHEPIRFEDMCETKTVTSALYLDMNEEYELPFDNNQVKDIQEHDYHFVGKAGSFCPIKAGCGGGLLLREKDGKYHAATGSKGYRWMESEMVKKLGKEEDVDQTYYTDLVDEAVKDISEYGDFEWFLSDDIDAPIGFNDVPPWTSPCGVPLLNCADCKDVLNCNYLDPVPFK